MRDCELSHIAFVQWEAPLTNCRPTTEGVRVDGHVIRKKYQMGGGNEGNVYHFYLSLNLIGSSRDFNACFQSGMLEILIYMCLYYIYPFWYSRAPNKLSQRTRNHCDNGFFCTILNRGGIFANTYAVGSGADLEFTIFVTKISVAPTSSSL